MDAGRPPGAGWQERFLMASIQRRQHKQRTNLSGRGGGGRKCRQGGFTLVEMTFSTLLLGLLLLSVTGIYTAMMRLTASITASAFVSSDAANAVQRVSDNLREAQNFEMMDGSGSVDGAAFGTSYDATASGTGTVLCVAGIRLFAPVAFQSPSAPPSGYPQGTVGIQINGRAGVTALAGAATPWDHNAAGATLDIYRASYKQKDTGGSLVPDGTPRPNDGACLWIKGTERGAVLDTLAGNTISGRPIVKDIAPVPNAVQFFQPLSNPADPTSPPMPNAVQVKIACGQYDLTHKGATSSDAAFGGASQISGDCVYMRDHTPFSATSTGANGHVQN